MGEQKSDPQLFNYAVNLEKRVRANHPLRQVKTVIDFSFAREEVAHCYGRNGNESVPPEVILKMMFLLFFDDIKSERELMEVIGERLDYLWFLDYGLDEHPIRRTIEYKAPIRVCAVCVLRAQCTRSHHGRTVQRHEKQALLDVARLQAHSAAARRDRKRRQHLIERSFADAANNHHFKRARWRRLWRQQIQDHLIAAIQNVRILLAHQKPKNRVAAAMIFDNFVARL